MNIMILERFPRLSAAVNSLLGQKKEPGPPRVSRYAKDVLKGEAFDIGEYTYCTDKPVVYEYPGRRLRIGKFCSIAP